MFWIKKKKKKKKKKEKRKIDTGIPLFKKIGIPLFSYIKVGFKGVYKTQTCYPDEKMSGCIPMADHLIIGIPSQVQKSFSSLIATR